MEVIKNTSSIPEDLRSKIKQFIINRVSDTLDVSEEGITEDFVLKDQLDSLEVFSIACDVDYEFDTDTSDSDIETWKTIGDMINTFIKYKTS